MPFSKEYWQKKRAEKNAAKLVEEGTQPRELPPTGDVLEPLSEADNKLIEGFMALLENAEASKQAELIVQKIVGHLPDLPLAARIKLAEHPLLQEAMESATKAASADLPPGSILAGGPGFEDGKDPRKYPWTKKPWTRKDLETMYEMVEWEPETDWQVAPHGISYRGVAYQKVRVPALVRDTWIQCRRDAMDLKREREAKMAQGAFGGAVAEIRQFGGRWITRDEQEEQQRTSNR